MDLSHITRKLPHYRSAEALQAEYRRTLPMMEEFLAAMSDDIAIVEASGWKFSVFWIRDDIQTIHCGLYHCCKQERGPDEIREDMETKILKRLPYDKVVWEI